MKKTLIAFAALSAIAGMAQAQSTVTIYGLVDANLSSLKTNVVVPAVGATPASVQSLRQTRIEGAGLNGNRWGIRVSEDLGGGMAAIANLESGFNIDTGTMGQGGLLFGRRANVGVSSGFGTVTLGRNSSSYDDVSADHTMMGQTIFDPSNNNNGNSAASVLGQVPGTAPAPLGTVAGNAAFLSKGGNQTATWVGFNTRFNNSVKYISPNFSGFSGSVMYGLGEDKTTTTSSSKTVSANLKYANGPLLVSGGYQSEEAPVVAATVGKPALQNTLLSVAYDFGVAKVGAGFNRAKYKDVQYNGHELAAQKEFSLSVAVPLGATTISAGYAQSKGDDLGKSTGYGVQALYSLSKRTTLYTGVASSKTYDTLANATAALAPTSNIGRNTQYALGVRHTF
jgi:predicted porin